MKQLTEKEFEILSVLHRYICAGTYLYTVTCTNCKKPTAGQCLACSARSSHKPTCAIQKSIPVLSKILDASEEESQPERDPSMEEEGWEQIDPETPNESF